MSQYTIELNNEQEKAFSKILKETGENATSYLKKILLEKLEDSNDLKILDEATAGNVCQRKDQLYRVGFKLLGYFRFTFKDSIDFQSG